MTYPPARADANNDLKALFESRSLAKRYEGLPVGILFDPNANELADRRDGWTPGPGLVLLDGRTWHLPHVDEGIIPSLPLLLPIALELRGLADGGIHRLPELMGRFLVTALSCQYRTPLDSLAALSVQAASVVEYGDPDKGHVLARHIVAVARFAMRRGLLDAKCEAVPVGMN